jgi:hypothetical protein
VYRSFVDVAQQPVLNGGAAGPAGGHPHLVQQCVGNRPPEDLPHGVPIGALGREPGENFPDRAVQQPLNRDWAVQVGIDATVEPGGAHDPCRVSGQELLGHADAVVVSNERGGVDPEVSPDGVDQISL